MKFKYLVAMGVKTLVCFVGLIAFSSAQLDVDLGGLIKDGMVFNIQQDIQGLLPQMNELVAMEKMSTVKLPDIKFRKKDEPVFSGITFEGLDKMTTVISGQATITGPRSITVSTSIVFENTKLSAAQYSEVDGDISWDIGNLTLAINMAMLPTKSGDNQCFTKYNRVRIVDMTNIVQHSSNTEFDGKTPENEAIGKIIRYYNQFLKNPRVLRKLSSKLDICKPYSANTNADNDAVLTTSELGASHREVMEQCRAKYPRDSTNADNRKCLAACLLKGIGIMNEDNTFNNQVENERIETMFSDKTAEEKQKIKDLVKECSSQSYTGNECDIAGAYKECQKTKAKQIYGNSTHMAIFMECRAQFNHSGLSSNPEERECFSACILKASGVMNQNNTFDIEKQISFMEKVLSDRSQDEIQKMKEIIQQCGNQSYNGTECSVAWDFKRCLETKVSKAGLEPVMPMKGLKGHPWTKPTKSAS